MKKLLLKILLSCFLIGHGIPSGAQNIIKAEYFFDTDPGFGNGTTLTLPASPDVQNFSFTANINSLPIGVHLLFIRTQDVNGNWSITNMILFYRAAVNASKVVTRMEYYINSDPGYGNGISIPVSSSDNIANLTFQADINSLPVGIHQLFIRSKDNEGSWSLSQMVLFYKGSKVSSPLVSQIEYFIDTDPGFGNGTSVPFTASENIGDLIFNIPACAIANGPHLLYVRTKDNAGNWSITNKLPFTKSGGGGLITPAVTVAASATTICSGNTVTFTATPVNGGTAPSYQWKVNGINSGTNSNIFSSSALINNDAVTVVMTSNAPCLTSPTSTSAPVIINVTSSVSPAVSITSSGSNICSGTNVTFTAAPVNGGTTPTYQWKVNGVNAGTNSNIFSSSSFNNNDVVMVVMTITLSCASTSTAVSNPLTITVTPSITPSVSIIASSSNICSGTSVTFTATPSNGGAVPTYQWKVNGANAGTNSNIFSSSLLSNNAAVTVVMTSNAGCTSTSTVTSNSITMTVSSIVTPSVSIVSSSANICSGTSVTFTATPSNGGAAPTYQWKVNGNNAGTNSSIFSTASLNNNDVITVVLTSNALCTTNPVATSNALTQTVNPLPLVNAGPGKTIDAGDSTRLDATASVSSGTINSIIWSPATGLSNPSILTPFAKPGSTTTYRIDVTTAAGCSASANVIITVSDLFKIPHGFSPNGDGINDVWNVRGISRYPSCIVKIYDRYGQPVFYSSGYSSPWNGKYNGKAVPVDTYYYIIDLKNGSKLLSGFVTIFK